PRYCYLFSVQRHPTLRDPHSFPTRRSSDLPGTLVVKKGTKVTVKLINNVKSEPNQHGFAIPGYNVAAIVNRGEPQTVEFTADKAGVFPIICQLHPAHVGGELVVLE